LLTGFESILDERSSAQKALQTVAAGQQSENLLCVIFFGELHVN
jgi:hypothetical protein